MEKPKKRIETQIHRRRKAKALSSLEVEWDLSDATPPVQLRMAPATPKSPEAKRR
jgi:hypothetical protein